MSNARLVRAALVGGKALSIDELVKTTGLSRRCVHSAVWQLICAGRADSFPVVYSLTPKGEEGGGRAPAKPPAKKVAPPNPPVPQQAAPKVIKPSAASEREVRSALINRHPLDSFFGARA